MKGLLVAFILFSSFSIISVVDSENVDDYNIEEVFCFF